MSTAAVNVAGMERALRQFGQWARRVIDTMAEAFRRMGEVVARWAEALRPWARYYSAERRHERFRVQRQERRADRRRLRRMLRERQRR